MNPIKSFRFTAEVAPFPRLPQALHLPLAQISRLQLFRLVSLSLVNPPPNPRQQSTFLSQVFPKTTPQGRMILFRIITPKQRSVALQFNAFL